MISLLCLGASIAILSAKSKPEPQDEIVVVGHIATTSAPVTNLVLTQHHSQNYLYAEHGSSKGITLLDVTKPAQPSVLSELPSSSDNFITVAGTAVLTTTQAQPAPASAVQTMRILNFSDPSHPVVTREFSDVSAIVRDEKRGLIFLANGEGIWILRKTFAPDPEVEAAYAHHVIYDH